MDPLGMTASIINVLQLTESLISYLNTTRNALTDQKNLADETLSLYHLLVTLRFRVEAARFDDPWYLEIKRLGEENGPLDQFKSALESIVVIAQPATGASKAKKVLMWNFDKKRVQEALTRMERLKTLTNLALQNDLFSLSRAIHDDVGAIFAAVPKIADSISQLQLHQTNEIQEKICRWLDAPDPSSNHNAACGKRQAGTGSWFLRSGQFVSWKRDPSSLLWTHGIPGCGKTILSSTIIQNVLQHRFSDVKSSVAYFYFDFSDPAKRRYDKLVRSLIIQISMQHPGGWRKLEQLYSICSDGGSQPGDDTLVTVLAELIALSDDTYIVLDALDECETREKLMELIQTITEWHTQSLHLLVTSRKERDIEEALESLLARETCIQSAVVDADIHVYIQERLHHDPKLKKWPGDVQLEIEQVLMQDADGMFRWVYCQLESIRKCVRRSDLRKTLGSLPKTLNDTYARILLNIPENFRSDAHRVLQWLCYSARPLRLAEVVEVLAINLDGETGFDPEERLPDVRDVITICSSLVSIVPLTDEYMGQMINEVHLAHFSVKEYLLSDQMPKTAISHFNLSTGLAHASIARGCLLYLLCLCSKGPLTQTILNDHPLARYAAEQWFLHMTVHDGSYITEGLNLLALKLLSSESGNLSTWLQLSDPGRPWAGVSLERRPESSSLYYSSLIGTLEVTRVFLKSGADVNTKGGLHNSALQAASYKGHTKTVELLLSQGTDANTRDVFYDSEVSTALYGDHDKSVEFLLSEGVEIRADALTAASDNGHKEIVALPLNEEAEIDANYALRAASFQGFKEIVELLLIKRVNVNTNGALEISSLRGHKKIVELLLNKDADVNACNALVRASGEGYQEIIELLLDHGADVNAQSEYGTPLRMASMRGHKETVKLLLNKGADVNARDALWAASQQGHKETVELLLDNGADVDAQSKGKNALGQASMWGHKETVELLLNKGADVNAQIEWRNALWKASAWGYKEIVELLLNKGADVNACNALQAASNCGHQEIVELLLSRGAKEVEEWSD